MRIRPLTSNPLALLLATCAVAVAGETNSSRQIFNLNTNWKFQRMSDEQQAEVSADSEHDPAANAFDGNPDTIWHTPWGGNAPPFPHWIQQDFGDDRVVSGVNSLPRAQSVNGWIRDYEIYVSKDGSNWGKAVAEGKFRRDASEREVTWKEVIFDEPVTARFLRFKALSGFTDDPFASMAELVALPEPEAEAVEEIDYSLTCFDDSKWESVHLPHTARTEPKEFHTHWQGISWYRRQFHADPNWAGRQVTIKFEAVMQQAEVWVNGQHLVTHDGGYLPFSVEVGKLLVFDGKTPNVLVVKANNHDLPDVPPGKPLRRLDFTYQGGIYRDVNLLVTDKLHLTDAVQAGKVGGGGVFVSYPEVSRSKAVVRVKAHVMNAHQDARKCLVKFALTDEDGRVVARSISRSHALASGEDHHFVQDLTVTNPRLWHPDSPNRYRVITRVFHGDELADSTTTSIGIRTVEWKTSGFYLNGRKLTLNGVNRHQDGIYVGNALPGNAQRLDARKIREAGFNNVRAAHYPLDPAFMDACDEFGLTVIACVPGWQHFSDTDTFRNNSFQNLRDLVRRDRNHPSVVLYEPVLNETPYPASFARTALAICREEDPGGFAVCDYGYPDAASYDVNYKVPDESKPFFTREWGDDTRFMGPDGDWANRADEHTMVHQSLARQKDLNGDGYWDWHGVNAKESTAGYALWVGMDHNRGGMPNLARCGIWGLDRHPKFCLQFFKSQRDPAIRLNGLDSGPMVFIASFWRESSFRNLNLYSNCEKVRLFLNDRLIGTHSPDTSYGEDKRPLKHVPHPVFTFEGLTWEPGTLRAEGLIGGRIVARHEVTTPGPAVRLEVELDHINRQLTADGSDMGLIFIKAVDKDGTLTPDFNGAVHVDIGGAGRLIGANPVTAEGGVAAIWLRSTTEPGQVEVNALSDALGATSFVTSTIQSEARFVDGPEVSPPRKIRRIQVEEAVTETVQRRKVSGFKVTASSSDPGSDPAQLADGNRESWWYAADNKDQWILLQLAAPTDLEGSLIIWEKDSTWYRFAIEVSADGATWNQVFEDSQTGHNHEAEEWTADAIRFARIKLHGVMPPDSKLGIREVELYQGR